MTKTPPMENFDMNLVVGPASIVERHVQGTQTWLKVKVRGYAVGSGGESRSLPFPDREATLIRVASSL